jgi:hypothetical protein
VLNCGRIGCITESCCRPKPISIGALDRAGRNPWVQVPKQRCATRSLRWYAVSIRGFTVSAPDIRRGYAFCPTVAGWTCLVIVCPTPLFRHRIVCEPADSLCADGRQACISGRGAGAWRCYKRPCPFPYAGAMDWESSQQSKCRTAFAGTDAKIIRSRYGRRDRSPNHEHQLAERNTAVALIGANVRGKASQLTWRDPLHLPMCRIL